MVKQIEFHETALFRFEEPHSGKEVAAMRPGSIVSILGDRIKEHSDTLQLASLESR